MESTNQIKKNNFRYDNITATNNLKAYKNELNNGLSQRQAAKKSGVPISTLRDLSRINENNFDIKVVEFIRNIVQYNFRKTHCPARR
ncbi:MAG: helix-turn-helix domain-containing protein [Bdellovibrionota bacterium]